MFAHVAIVAKVGKGMPPLLSYKILPDDLDLIKVGALLYVPFRNSSTLGVVFDVTDSSSGFDESQLKTISDIPLYPLHLPANHLRWAEKIHRYYHVPLGSVLRLMFPGALLKGQKRLQKKWFNEPFSYYSDIPSLNLKKLFSLSVDQEQVYRSILTESKPVLLHGVTGSGKTELYRHLAVDVLSRGQQVVLLVPEIALTTPMVRAFIDLAPDTVAVFHSKLSLAEEAAAWWKVYTGQASLIIGSRSALFAPVRNPGLIVIDEEHAWTYKQEQLPYYNTQDIAVWMAEGYGAKLLLGSATPRIESYFQAIHEKKWAYLSLPHRINEQPLPPVTIVDMRDELRQKNFSIFSMPLQRKIEKTLMSQQQTILFVNRRGLAGAMLCRDCGSFAKCPRCEIGLTFHRGITPAGILICHYCHHQEEVAPFCFHCRSSRFKQVGLGTQKVEEEVRRLFPRARVVRADQDTTRHKDGFTSIYNDFLAHRYDILIGTQMVAKGLDFERVSLVGIVLADVGIHIPDFRSSERVFQLISQVSGRAGRGKYPGEVVLQTYNPDLPAIRMAAEYRYGDFVELELQFRRTLRYPPFGRLIKCTVLDVDQNNLEQLIQKQEDVLHDILQLNHLPLQVFSAPAMIFKMAGHYYYHLFIRGEEPQMIFDYWTPPHSFRIDIDPIDTT